MQPLFSMTPIEPEVAATVATTGLTIASTIAAALWRALQTERDNGKELMNAIRDLEAAHRSGNEAATYRQTLTDLRLERLQGSVDDLARHVRAS